MESSMRMFHILIQRGDSLGSFTTAIELYPAYSVHCTERRGWGERVYFGSSKDDQGPNRRRIS